MLAVTRGFRSELRGYSVVYKEDEINHCPGCGRTQWLIGRVSAECAFCCTAIPLEDAQQRDRFPTFLTRGNGGGKVT